MNVDIATGVMLVDDLFIATLFTLTLFRFRQGPLLDVAVELLGFRNYRGLSGLGQDRPEFRQLKSLLLGLRVRQMRVGHSSQKFPNRPGRVHQVRSIVHNAGGYKFTLDNGEGTTVAARFLFPPGSSDC